MANDTGSSYWLIGGDTPAPAPVTPAPTQTAPVSPFEKYLIALENLQAPLELPASSYQQPAAPTFTPMAAPTAVRVDPASKFGPVTASGYAIKPVDPMSYYSTPEPIVQSIANPNAPRRWFDVYKPTPDLSNAETFSPIPDQSQTFTPEPEPTPDSTWASAGTGTGTPNTSSEQTLSNELEDTGVSLITPENIEKYIKEGKMDLQNPSAPETPKQDENVKQVTTEEAAQMIGNQTPNVPGSQGETVTPGKEGPLEQPYTVVGDIVKPTSPTLPPVPTYEFKNNVKPTYTEILRKPGELIPFKMPTEVPIPGRRAAELLAPGYFKDVNYDPEQILAAAMRVLRGRGAGRSLME